LRDIAVTRDNAEKDNPTAHEFWTSLIETLDWVIELQEKSADSQS
jgi:hypothetical protein